MRHWMWLAALAVGLAGCSMTASTAIDNPPSGLGCSSAGGSYYLSKTHLTVEVKRRGRFTKGADNKPQGEPTKTWYEMGGVGQKRVPDRRHGYCLDYIASASADEKLRIQKDDNYLLSTISTQTIDQSRYILTSLINAVFTGIAGVQGSDFRAAAAGEMDADIEVAFRGEYDPFDVEQSAIVNNALSAVGFCVVLEGHTFDLSRDTIDAYCSDPSRALAGRPVSRRNSESPDKENGLGREFRQPDLRGVLYRPRVPYNYYLFVRQLDRGRVRWKLRQTTTIALENGSPVISVGVDRSFFASRRTALIFDAGVLKNVCVYKSSELEEVAEIPFSIADNLAKLPANVLQLRLDNTNNYKRLTDVQDRLIQAQADHLNVISQTGAAAQYQALSESQKQTTYTAPQVAAVKRTVETVGDQNKEIAAGFPDWSRICPDYSITDPAGTALTAPQATVFQSDIAPK